MDRIGHTNTYNFIQGMISIQKKRSSLFDQVICKEGMDFYDVNRIQKIHKIVQSGLYTIIIDISGNETIVKKSENDYLDDLLGFHICLMKYLYPKSIYKDLVKMLDDNKIHTTLTFTKAVIVAKIGVKNYDMLYRYFAEQHKPWYPSIYHENDQD